VLDDVDAPVVTAIQHILARAQKHDVIAGIHNGTAETARRRLEMGFRFVSISSDARLMAAGAQQALAQVRR
jgi:4-hydroxy-2-oxoheptanedioate aldolase